MPGLSLIAVSGSYSLSSCGARISHCTGFSCCGVQALGTRVCGLSICGDGLSWDLPRPGIEPVPPALQGFLTTGPPRKTYDLLLRFITFIYLDIWHLSLHILLQIPQILGLGLVVLLLLLLLSRFSRVRLCATPQTAAHQASPPLGFSRQEHWSGLPFPSPVRESEKWKWSRSVVSDSSDPMDHSLPGSSVHGIFQARVLEWWF